jgi:hypothetical protein
MPSILMHFDPFRYRSLPSSRHLRFSRLEPKSVSLSGQGAPRLKHESVALDERTFCETPIVRDFRAARPCVKKFRVEDGLFARRCRRMHMQLNGRFFLAALLFTVFMTGCAATPSRPTQLVLRSEISDESMRAELLAFSDTASTRVNQLCDQIVRDADRGLATFRDTKPTREALEDAVEANTRIRSRANIEKISIANLCMETTANPRAMSGFIDLTFAITIKARNADRRAARAATKSAGEDPLDPWADAFVRVYKRCSDDMWTIADKALTRDQLEGLAQMIETYLTENTDLRYASAKAMDLQKYVGNDPKRTSAFSLVDLKSTNAQVDRILWMTVRMPDLIRYQAKQAMFDASKELAVFQQRIMTDLEASAERISERVTAERVAAVNDATAALNEARAKAVEHAMTSAHITANEIIDRLMRQFFWWVLLPAGCLALLFLVVTVRGVRAARVIGRVEKTR